MKKVISVDYDITPFGHQKICVYDLWQEEFFSIIEVSLRTENETFQLVNLGFGENQFEML